VRPVQEDADTQVRSLIFSVQIGGREERPRESGQGEGKRQSPYSSDAGDEKLDRALERRIERNRPKKETIWEERLGRAARQRAEVAPLRGRL